MPKGIIQTQTIFNINLVRSSIITRLPYPWPIDFVKSRLLSFPSLFFLYTNSGYILDSYLKIIKKINKKECKYYALKYVCCI